MLKQEIVFFLGLLLAKIAAPQSFDDEEYYDNGREVSQSEYRQSGSSNFGGGGGGGSGGGGNRIETESDYELQILSLCDGIQDYSDLIQGAYIEERISDAGDDILEGIEAVKKQVNQLSRYTNEYLEMTSGDFPRNLQQQVRESKNEFLQGLQQFKQRVQQSNNDDREREEEKIQYIQYEIQPSFFRLTYLCGLLEYGIQDSFDYESNNQYEQREYEEEYGSSGRRRGGGGGGGSSRGGGYRREEENNDYNDLETSSRDLSQSESQQLRRSESSVRRSEQYQDSYEK